MSGSRRHKVCFVFGTRPEAIKVAPVIAYFWGRDEFEVVTLLTGQHRQMLDQVVELFQIPVDHDLDVMQAGQSPAMVTARLCERIGPVLQVEKPDCVVVQGDTTSCFVGALAAFYERIPVAHIEAGLRTNDFRQPFPEEMNRRMVGAMADFHFAPTAGAREALLRENVNPGRVWVTGNTGIDALRIISERRDVGPEGELAAALGECNGTLITVTSHRRENLPFMKGIALAVRDLLEGDDKLDVIFPVHLSPAVRGAVEPILSDVRRCRLIEPLPYDQFVLLMKRSDLLLTDSGGIQEEAPHLGKPVLVMRRKTERPEAVEAGTAILVGDERESIVRQTRRVLDDDSLRRRMSEAVNPFGDGFASERIAEILGEQLRRTDAEAGR